MQHNLRLAELSKEAHDKTAKYLKNNIPQKKLTAIHLGRLRVDIKKHLASELYIARAKIPHGSDNRFTLIYRFYYLKICKISVI